MIYVSQLSTADPICVKKAIKFTILKFLRASAMLKHVIDIGWTSVRPSVRHTLVLYQNG